MHTTTAELVQQSAAVSAPEEARSRGRNDQRSTDALPAGAAFVRGWLGKSRWWQLLCVAVKRRAKRRSTTGEKTPRRVAKILEIGPFPPPRAGWGIRIEFVQQRIQELGHVCTVLNIGKSRRVPSDRYVTVKGPIDYVVKVLWYSAKGYTIHAHTNGDVWPTGWALTLVAELAGCLFARRTVLTFHAGTQQVYFPRERSGKLYPIVRLLFTLPRGIICNSPAVKEKIVEYGISGAKIVPIPAFSQQYLRSEIVPLNVDIERFLVCHRPVILTYAQLRDGYNFESVIESVDQVRRTWPEIGIVVTGDLEDSDPFFRARIAERIEQKKLSHHVCFADDLEHDQFLTLLRRANVYLRTPTTDGVSASVLEALSLGVPVVAAENGTRPASVATFPASNAKAMGETIVAVLSDEERFRNAIARPCVRDTVSEEANVLIRMSTKRPLHAMHAGLVS